MEIKGKAHYCGLLNEAGIEIGLGDHRALSDEELFEALEGLDISLDAGKFLEITRTAHDPEEVVEIVAPDESDSIRRSQIYLLLFEAWRRFVKDKKNLSIFCDELDYTIALFYEEELGNEEYLQGLVSRFENILDEAVDANADPQVAMKAISPFFTFPIEIFLYDYIAFQLEEENETYASELIDGFYSYLSDPRWFDLLKVVMAEDLDILYQHFLESLFENPEFELCLETLHYLVSMGQPLEIAKVLKVALFQMETEEDIQDLMGIVGDYLEGLDPATLKTVLKNLPKPFQDLFPS